MLLQKGVFIVCFVIFAHRMKEGWDYTIKSKRTAWNFEFKALWKYRYLILLFFKRDFVANYKQTVLGPLWFVIQPILTTVIFTFVFGNLAGLAPEGVPDALFFMSGIVVWNYFADVFVKTSNIFRQNANIFGKVYFPRMAVPISVMLASMLKFLVQFLLLLVVFCYYWLNGEVDPNLDFIALTPISVIVLGILAMGLGNITSALTAKYRDFTHLVSFGIQLLMYTTTVIYPLSKIIEWANASEAVGDFSFQKVIVLANPVTSIIESFRVGFCNHGLDIFNWNYYWYSIASALVIFLVSVVIFNKTEQNFIDTV